MIILLSAAYVWAAILGGYAWTPEPGVISANGVTRLMSLVCLVGVLACWRTEQ